MGQEEDTSVKQKQKTWVEVGNGGHKCKAEMRAESLDRNRGQRGRTEMEDMGIEHKWRTVMRVGT